MNNDYKQISVLLGVMITLFTLAAGFLYMYSKQIVEPEPEEVGVVVEKDKLERLLQRFHDETIAITDRARLRSYCRKATFIAALGAEEQVQIRRLLNPDYVAESRIALDRIQSTLATVQSGLKQDIEYLEERDYRLPSKDECKEI